MRRFVQISIHVEMNSFLLLLVPVTVVVVVWYEQQIDL